MHKKIKIGIIGVGHVGSHVASSLVMLGGCDELVIIDKDTLKGQSHALDLEDSVPYMTHDQKIYAGEYSDLKDADFIVVSACAEFADEDRLKELDSTLEVMDEIIPQIKGSGFGGIIISISNPCDLIAQYLREKTKLQVIGTGTMLDSARMRLRVARALGISAKSVQGYALGEHGDSQMVAWSTVKINGICLEEWMKANGAIDQEAIAKSTNTAGWDIVKGKHCTEFGIGAAANELIQAISHDQKSVLPCSVYLEEQGVYASVPCIIGANGVEQRLYLELTKEEEEQFEASCEVLRKNLFKLER